MWSIGGVGESGASTLVHAALFGCTALEPGTLRPSVVCVSAKLSASGDPSLITSTSKVGSDVIPGAAE